MFQPVPSMAQPVIESPSVTMDRVWYRFFSGIVDSATDLSTTVANLSTSLDELTTKVGTLPTNPLVFVAAPAHNTSPGAMGQVAFDSGFFYVCIATDSWARIAIGGSW